jgi:hypothetical protein
LLCLSATQRFYEATDEQRATVRQTLHEAFGQLEKRFEVQLLGGFDDDLLSHGASRPPPLRVLLRLTTTQQFFDATDDERAAVKQVLRSTLWSLADRFMVTVLGSMNDDLLRLGAGHGCPYRGYIMLDADGFGTVEKICQLVSDARVRHQPLSGYVLMDVVIGRPL